VIFIKEIIYTSEYPIRYEAWKEENKDKIVVNSSSNINYGGCEIAVYSNQVLNPCYKDSNLRDGVYGSIESYQGKDFFVALVLTLPNHSRKQFIREKRFKYFGEALSYLQEMIEELNKIWMD